MNFYSSTTRNRRFDSLQGWSKLRIADLFRVLNRLLTGKLRLFALFVVFGFLFISVVKMLQPTSGSNFLVTSDLDDQLSNSRDDLQYAVMIDAGSSGSRVHIYVWPPHSGDPRQLLKIRMLHDELGKDVYSKLTPGLSSRSADPSSANEYIDPLLKFAAQNIPQSKHKETPLFILATAGMRMLPLKTQEDILNDLRNDIPKNYSFLFPANHAQVIPGKEEGIYSWIAVNYLMGRFDHSLSHGGQLTSIDVGSKITTRTRTIGMLEMGGASVQIAYEVTSKYQLEALRKQLKSDELVKSVIAEFNLGCSTHDSDHEYHLFVTTYLGLGANVARTSYVNSLLSTVIPEKETTSLDSKLVKVPDPCLNIDSSENVTIARKHGNSTTNYIYVLKGSGDFNNCALKLKGLLDPKIESSKMCYASANVSCPLTQLRDTKVPYDMSEIYGFSELWYTANDVLGLGGAYQFETFQNAASQYCSTSWSVLQDRFKRKLYPLADHERLVHQCFKSAWMSTVLHDGFKMPKSFSKYRSALNVNGEQIQWTLGALLYRTRFFPLRAIEQLYNVNHQRPNYNSYINYILFILCMFAVVVCILVYLKHLHKLVNNYDIAKNLDEEDATNLISVQVDEPTLVSKR